MRLPFQLTIVRKDWRWTVNVIFGIGLVAEKLP
jgi:hypothetical protein